MFYSFNYFHAHMSGKDQPTINDNIINLLIDQSIINDIINLLIDQSTNWVTE